MNTATILAGACLGEQDWLEMEEFARACGVETAFVRELVDEGLLRTSPPWRFGGEEITRVRRICRLQRDFDANLQSVAVMLDLLDEIERLRLALLRAGMAA